MGIRPEDIDDPSYAASEIVPAEVDATVEVTELMGNEVFVYLRSGEQEYIARVDPRTSARVGDGFKALFNTDNMHLFDAQTELAIR